MRELHEELGIIVPASHVEALAPPLIATSELRLIVCRIIRLCLAVRR